MGGHWRSWFRGLLTFLLVGGCGRFHNPEVVCLAITAGLVLADLGKRDTSSASEPQVEDRLGLVLQGGFVLLLAAAAYDNRSPLAVGSRWGASATGYLHILGSSLIAVGVGIRQWAVAAMGRHFTVRLQVLEDHQVIRSGPYRWLRHPNYLGLLLVGIGTVLIFHSPAGMTVLGLVWLPAVVLRMNQEEALLCRRLGDAYASYQQGTWRLIPLVY